MRILRPLFGLIGLAPVLAAAQFQVGVARVDITPPLPFWLSGYASRTNPVPEVRHPLTAKALVLEDSRGGRLVLITAELVGIPREVSDAVAARLEREFGVARSQLIINVSHTHAGPVVWPNLKVGLDLAPADLERAQAYAQSLIERLVSVGAQALAARQAAEVSYGVGEVGFAMNRREPTPNGIRLGVNPSGPVDHSVPVLRISAPDGATRVLVFGYACHNTTLGGDFHAVDGDYAGFAMRALEQIHPGTTSLFLMLCGGDQNPHPRGTIELAEQHGNALAQAVDAVLAGPLTPLEPPLRTAYREVDLDLAPHTRDTFVRERETGSVTRRRRAALMLDAYDRNLPVRQVRQPVQATHIGSDFTLLALGHEVVVDYALTVRRQFPQRRLIIAGYCNDVACYIPTVKILAEGGYEPVDSMVYYGQPGPFAETVEAQVLDGIRAVMENPD